MAKTQDKMGIPGELRLSGVPISRLDYGRSSIGVTSTGVRLIGGNKRRVAIGFSPSVAGNAFFVHPDRFINGVGLIVPGNGPLLWFTLTENGPMVQSEWWGSSPFAVTAVTCEVFVTG